MRRGTRVVVDTGSERAQQLRPGHWIKALHGQQGEVVHDSLFPAPAPVLLEDQPHSMFINEAFLRVVPPSLVRVGQRYWRYDPDQDAWVTRPHDWIPVVVVVKAIGIGINHEPGLVLNPGMARWLGNRLIEAAVVFELQVADPEPGTPEIENDHDA